MEGVDDIVEDVLKLEVDSSDHKRVSHHSI